MIGAGYTLWILFLHLGDRHSLEESIPITRFRSRNAGSLPTRRNPLAPPDDYARCLRQKTSAITCVLRERA